jgi:hypothetical protein
MKILPAALTALAIAAIAPIPSPTVGNTPAGPTAIDTVAAPDKPAPLILAQSRRRCQEDLGYGRTGSYGCG